MCRIDWQKPSNSINNLIRGLSPYPCAFFIQNGKLYKIYESRIVSDKILNPGEFLQKGEQLFVGCGDGALEIFEIQQEGRKKLTVPDFLRGTRI